MAWPHIFANSPAFPPTTTPASQLDDNFNAAAPLDSPVFINNPTAPTAAGTDNSTTLATTAMVQAAIAAAGVSGVPSGAIMPFGGASAPSGWTLCFGQAVSRTTFATLFSVIGTTFGVGDGTTTFNLPDLRGRAAYGADAMGGTPANRLGSGNTGGITGSATVAASGGTQSHTLTSAEQASMSVTGTATNNNGGGTSGTGSGAYDNTAVNVTGPLGGFTISGTAAGGNGAHNILNPALVLNYIIKQ